MAYSKSINIFLPTGSSDGAIELEMLNWNGMVIKVPRKEVDTYTGIEMNKPGICFLFCKSEESGDSVYVGVACFYLNCDDIAAHKRVISYFIDNNLIRRTKAGRLYNISFKLDSQTLAHEYGENFYSEIKLSKFVDSNTGELLI